MKTTTATIKTPWGPAQHVKDHGQGVLSVDTAGHGGIYVPSELLRLIPAAEQRFAARWSGSVNWYEEDCAAAIPMFRLGHLFQDIPEAKRQAYYDTVKSYWS